MSLRNFFEPKAVAVIGASNKRGKVGYALAKNLQSFKGKLFWVNRKRETIFGRESVASVLEIRENTNNI